MINSIIHTQIENILDNFSADNADYIRDLMGGRGFDLSDREEYVLMKIVRSIDSNTSQTRKDWFVEILERIFIDDDGSNRLYAVAKGEEFEPRFRISRDAVKNDRALVITDHNNNVLSRKNNYGVSESVDVNESPLAENTFHKLFINLENLSNQGYANGDVTHTVRVVFLYIGDVVNRDSQHEPYIFVNPDPDDGLTELHELSTNSRVSVQENDDRTLSLTIDSQYVKDDTNRDILFGQPINYITFTVPDA